MGIFANYVCAGENMIVVKLRPNKNLCHFEFILLFYEFNPNILLGILYPSNLSINQRPWWRNGEHEKEENKWLEKLSEKDEDVEWGNEKE